MVDLKETKKQLWDEIDNKDEMEELDAELEDSITDDVARRLAG